MHHYTYSWSKESDNEFTYYPYSLEVTAKMPAEDLWKEWEQCFVDPTKCWLWPTQYSRPRFETLPARSGGKFVLEYKMPNFRNPSAPPTDITYDYEMVEWKPEEMFCKYVGVGRHIFRGGGETKIKAIEKNLCTFRWEGWYRYTAEGKSSQKLEYEFASYFNAFLIATALNIEKKTSH